MKRWEPAVPDEQMIAEARTEDVLRSIDRWESSRDGLSHTAYDVDGNVVAISCGGGRLMMDEDPELVRQSFAGEESQDPGDYTGDDY